MVVVMDGEGIRGQLCQQAESRSSHHWLLALTAPHSAAGEALIPLPGPRGRGGAWRVVSPQKVLAHTIMELRKTCELFLPTYCIKTPTPLEGRVVPRALSTDLWQSGRLLTRPRKVAASLTGRLGVQLLAARRTDPAEPCSRHLSWTL